MFFFVSKILWMVASPINLLLFAALIGILLCYGRRARFGRVLALTAILVLLAAAILPAGMVLIAPLEDRFPIPSPDLAAPGGDYRARRGHRRRHQRRSRPDNIRRRGRADHGGRHSRQALSQSARHLYRWDGFVRSRRLVNRGASGAQAHVADGRSRRSGSPSRTSRATRRKTHASPRRWFIRSRRSAGSS